MNPNPNLLTATLIEHLRPPPPSRAAPHADLWIDQHQHTHSFFKSVQSKVVSYRIRIALSPGLFDIDIGRSKRRWLLSNSIGTISVCWRWFFVGEARVVDAWFFVIGGGGRQYSTHPDADAICWCCCTIIWVIFTALNFLIILWSNILLFALFLTYMI